MASNESSLNDQHSHSNGITSNPRALALPKKGPAPPRNSDQERRNRMNMEKMIMKNVAASRNSTKNRAQQILETLKRKRQLEETQDEKEKAAQKKKKMSPPQHDVTSRTAVAAGILSPRRSVVGTAAFTSPARRQTSALNLKSPTPPLASPARARAVNPLHLLSPARPPKSAVQASPARPKRSGTTTASPLRRTDFLTSPLRHRASASPKRPLVFDESTIATNESSSTMIHGHPPLLSLALEQVEGAPVFKTAKAIKTMKSPFQSFQDKYKQSPMKTTRSVEDTNHSARAESTSFVPRSGPTLDLSHTSDTAPPRPTTSAASSLGSTVQSATSSEAAVETARAASTASSQSNIETSASTAFKNALKPMRKLFSSARIVVAQRSICFSTEAVATALDVAPDGEIIVVGFMDGSVRLYQMDSSVPSDRHGYLLGHIDEQSSQGSSNVNLRVKISPDGRYVFVGCRQGPRVIMSINLDHYRSEKDGDDDDFQHFQKHFQTNTKLRGFADVTTYVPPVDSYVPKEQQESKDKRSAYYILTGLGVGNLNLWRFVEPKQHDHEPLWEHLQNFGAGGNTATTAAFLPSRVSPGVMMIAAVCKDKNLRVWPLEFKKMTLNPEAPGSEECVVEKNDTRFLGGNHAVASHFSVQNTSDIIAIHGQYAYGISLMGEAYRICFPDASNVSSSTCERLRRQEFQLEKIGGGGGGTSRRSNIMLESLSASDDGKTLVAVSTEGIFYYSSKLPDVDASEMINLRIIGKNASENTLFKTPMKVYTAMVKSLNGTKTQSEAMMAVVTNPSCEDSENRDGYINVDPTELFASRWMVPSRGNDCWVCGVRNMCHWIGPPESKPKEPNRATLSAAERKEKLKAQKRRDRAQKRARDAVAKQQKSNIKTDDNQQETSTIATLETTSLSINGEVLSHQSKPVHSHATAESTAVTVVDLTASKRRQSCGIDDDDDGECTGSDDNAQSVASLISELEHFKKRNAEIKTEWQRRLQGERQLRRKWKQREEEFLDQLNDSLTKLDAAEMEVDRLRVLLSDAEKRFTFEKVRLEQENSVKSRYEQLCAHMNEKMALVVDQKRLLEQTTRSLLAEVDRNVHALKNAVILEKSECVVCKDQQAVTAIVPCGHLCFCESDAETYRHNCTSKDPTCPICQQEIVSLLRIYT